LAELQTQLVARRIIGEKEEETALRPRYGFQPEIAKPLLFNGNVSKVVEFITAYKLYIRMRMREKDIEKHVIINASWTQHELG